MATEERASVCTFDCPDACSLRVSVVDDRIVKVRGSEAAPYTGGVICNKVAREMTEFVHGPGRLLYPLRRLGPKGSDQFERISWDMALDDIHKRVNEIVGRWGPQAVMPLNYAGPHGLLAGDSMSSRFFNRLGATQLYRRALCGGVRSEAWSGTYGAVPGCPPELAEAAKLNLVWGNNATVTNLHLVRCIRKSKRAGGRLIVVDPLRTKIAEQADLHLQLLPGTDVVLAWALAAELERSGALNAGFHCRLRIGSRGFHGSGPPMAGGASGCGLRAEGERDPRPSRAGSPRSSLWWFRRATGSNAAATAAALSGRQSPCRRCSESWARVTASCSAQATRFPRPRTSCSGPI